MGNMLFSVNLLKRHSLSLGPPDAPSAFVWTLEQPGVAPRPVAIHDWNDAADAAYRQGMLKDPANPYYLSATTRPDVYVNTFGLGAALAGLPVYALLDLFVDIEADHFWWWHGGALTASLLIALAAVCVFLAARTIVRPLPALLVALAFGLGSCAWPVSSQALWQHPASTFCLSPVPCSCCAAASARAPPPGAVRRSGWPCCAAPRQPWWCCAPERTCCGQTAAGARPTCLADCRFW